MSGPPSSVDSYPSVTNATLAGLPRTGRPHGSLCRCEHLKSRWVRKRTVCESVCRKVGGPRLEATRLPRIQWVPGVPMSISEPRRRWVCLLYTSGAADDLLCVDLGGRRI